MNIPVDVCRTPYSRRGSWLCVRPCKDLPNLQDGLYVRSVHADALPSEMLLFEPLLDGQVLDYAIEADVRSVRMKTVHGAVDLCLTEPDVLRFRSQGLGLRLVREQDSWGECAMRAPGGRWELNTHLQRLKCMFHPLAGTCEAQLDYTNPGMKNFSITFLPGTDGAMEGALEIFHRGWHEREIDSDFDADADALVAEFSDWLGRTPPASETGRDEFEGARQAAAYTNWSSLVPPEGHLEREAMLMSKNHMLKCWSWDNCFNALATAVTEPGLAWDQLVIHFDHQAEDGCIPDTMSANLMFWAFNKPPIQGWVLREMERCSDVLTPARVAAFYEPLCRWTQWWYAARDYDKDGVLNYNHGNDSGWDNASAFDLSPCVEGPDLMAFLVIQCDVLADYAQRLGREEESAQWRRRGQETLAKMIEHSWRETGFVSTVNETHEVADGDCLLNFIPIVLGKRLPAEIRNVLIGGLKDETRFLAPAGFATESMKSKFYTGDGYWRGPVWAPSTLILLTGLRDCGEDDLVRDVALRFCRACKTSGFAENFDAITCESRRDSGYTWTSSVFLILVSEYL